MELIRACIRVLLAVLLATSALDARAQAQDSRLVALAQRTPVATLDSGLTGGSFAQWLTTLRPLPAGALRWEVNDCGEGGDGRAAPTCVEAILKLGPDTTAHASLIVAGLDRRSVKPAVSSLYIMVRDSITTVKRLREWAKYVRLRAGGR